MISDKLNLRQVQPTAQSDAEAAILAAGMSASDAFSRYIQTVSDTAKLSGPTMVRMGAFILPEPEIDTGLSAKVLSDLDKKGFKVVRK